MPSDDLIVAATNGLYCPAGDFHIDPWQPVPRAVITHAHGDHASAGSQQYLCAADGAEILRARMGASANIQTLAYAASVTINGVVISFYPAGHVLGSAQVRLEYKGQVCVVYGDYKLAQDATCAPFEAITCHTFVTESTFGLPIYRWQPQESVFDEINVWWRQNAAAGRASIVYAYSLGKAQRVLAGIDASVGPIYCHGAVERMNAIYRAAGVPLPATEYTGIQPKRHDFSDALIVAPPSARGTRWLRRFGDAVSGFASGWMQIRGARRRRAVDRGFVLSDHADWPGLQSAIQATGAHRILVTHGTIGPFVRWLTEHGYDAAGLQTRYEGEQDEAGMEPDERPADADSGVIGE